MTSLDSILIPGPLGPLEVHYQAAPQPAAKLAILCAPHPQRGGTMHNKIISTLARVFAHRGYAVARFHYRGVGRSSGSFDQGRGEVDDAQAVWEWAAAEYGHSRVVWAGFSFGSWVALQMAWRAPVPLLGLVTVAPALTLHDYYPSIDLQAPWICLMGEEDEIVPYALVQSFFQDRLRQHPNQSLWRSYPAVGHFFHGHLPPLAEGLHEALNHYAL